MTGRCFIMDISTEIYFLQALAKYVDEKPYTMRYVPESPLTASNVIREKQTVKVKDVRGIEDQYSLDRNGFMVAKLATKMSYSDFGDSSLITARYLNEVREMLRSIFPSAEIDFASYLVSLKSQLSCHETLTALVDSEKRRKLPSFNRTAV